MVEQVIEDEIVENAEADGWFTRKLGWEGRAGAPDRIFIKRSRVVFIEVKDYGENVVPGSIQDREIRRMVDAGAEVHVCNTPQQGRDALGIK